MADVPNRPAREALLLINPRAGRGRGRRCARRLRRRLEAAGLRFHAVFSRGPGDVEVQARRACEAGYGHLVVAGGDGTLHEAVNGVMAHGGEIALGLIPLGSGNDFAKAADVPADWRAATDLAVARIRAGRVRRVDVGRCNGFFFANGLGLGLDAEVTSASERLKWLPGSAAYVAALLGLLARGAPVARARIEHDGGRLEQRIAMAVACNGRWIGGVFHLAPTARLDDGQVRLVLAEPLTRRQILRYAPRVMRGRHEGLPMVRLIDTAKLRLEVEPPLVLEADGEIRDRRAARVELEVLPGALALLA